MVDDLFACLSGDFTVFGDPPNMSYIDRESRRSAFKFLYEGNYGLTEQDAVRTCKLYWPHLELETELIGPRDIFKFALPSTARKEKKPI